MAKSRRKVPRRVREAESSRRIAVDPSRWAPNNSWAPPPLYYEDLRFTCVDCGCEEVWTASQQKWWYEVAKGSIYARAVRCGACRRRQRESQQGTPRKSHRDRLRESRGEA
jgi:hypothetical protein